MKLLFWTSFWVFLADQITKYAVVHGLGLISDDDGRITVFPGFFEFRMAWNRGVNFGLGADYDLRWVLIGVACAISAFVVVWLWRSKATKMMYIAGGLLVGGAIGNVVDRVIYGAVADFLNVSCCGINNPFAFNIADVAIFVGAVGLALAPEPSKKKPAKK